MSEIDPVILRLIADTKTYQAEIRDATTRVQNQLGKQEASVKRLEAQFSASSQQISSSIRNVAGSLAAYMSGKELVSFADGFTRVQNALKVAGLEGQNLASVQQQLLGLSGKYGVSIEELARLYGNSSQAASELGATQSQLVQLTEATAQSLKITGATTEQAQGAMLGLVQALASGSVKAEEFNQINEGGLRPLLQVAANTEKFGGSIAKLRAAVVDGKLSSADFFDAIMNGSQQLGDKANQAVLTLSGGFEALKSALTVYIGEADAANGVSAALGEAMKSLADNLNVVIPALAAIAVGMGTSMVASAVAGSGAVFALTAVLGGAATAAEGLTFAAAGLTAVLGNPIVLALAAVAAGMTYFALTSNDAEEAVSGQGKAADVAAEYNKKLNDILSQDQSDNVAAGARNLAQARREAADAAYKQAKAEIALRKAQALKTYNLAKQGKQEETTTTYEQVGNTRGRRAVTKTNIVDIEEPNRTRKWGGNYSSNAGKKALAAANAYKQAVEDEATLAAAYKESIASPRKTGAATESDADRKKREADAKKAERERLAAQKKAAREAEQAAREALQSRTEDRQSQMEILRAKQDLSVNIDDHAAYEREMLAIERAQRQDELDSNKNLSSKERAARQSAIDELYGKAAQDGLPLDESGLLSQKIAREENAKIAQEQLDLQKGDLSNQQDLLSAQADLTDTRKERLAIELKLLDLAYEQQKSDLEATLDSKTATAAQKEIAQRRLDILDALKAANVEKANRDYESPMASYRREIATTGAEINDNMESIAVDGLQSLNSGLAEAIVNSKSLGDVFGNVAKSIISNLIQIALQQTIVNSLSSGLSALLGGSSTSGLSSQVSTANANVSSLASSIVPGFASGTNYAPGGIALVGENGPELVNLPQGAKVTPNTQLAAAMSGSSTTVIQTLKFDLSGAVMTPQLLAQMNQMAQQAAVGGAMAGANLAESNISSRNRRRIPGQ